jgi:uncharacterized protein (TIGR03032 family)
MTKHLTSQPPIENFLHMRYFEATASPGLASWLDEQQVSLAFTNSAARLFMVGLQDDGQLSIHDSAFTGCLGLATAGVNTIYMATRYQIWRLENALRPGQLDGGYDRLYVPQSAYTTGNLQMHDLAVDRTGQVVFINTLYNCLATVSERHSFTPLWRPPFISALAAGNRCHLSGLALRDGLPAFATSATRTDVPDAWRDQRRTGGTLLDIATSEVVASGLCMPDSPRWYRDRLWLANAGSGEFGWIDLATGRFEALARCPGILRGLCFVGEHAILGVSMPQPDDLYSGLALDDYLHESGTAPRCGLLILNLRTGALDHWLFFAGKNTRQIYDVIALPGVRRPMSFVPIWEEIQELVTIGPPEPLIVA